MALISNTPLILASGSVVRQQMLAAVGVKFSIRSPGHEETAMKPTIRHLPLSEQALRLANVKAAPISRAHPEALVIGADQICSLDGEIFSKPGTFENAAAQLRRLSGKTHTQTCAAVLLQGGESIWTWVEEARLTMRALSDAEIEAYIRADTPLAACGAYKIEAHGRHLFTAIQGDQDVIKGLPLNPLLAELHKIGAVALA
jgi:septum formation protein